MCNAVFMNYFIWPSLQSQELILVTSYQLEDLVCKRKFFSFSSGTWVLYYVCCPLRYKFSVWILWKWEDVEGWDIKLYNTNSSQDDFSQKHFSSYLCLVHFGLVSIICRHWFVISCVLPGKKDEAREHQHLSMSTGTKARRRDRILLPWVLTPLSIMLLISVNDHWCLTPNPTMDLIFLYLHYLLLFPSLNFNISHLNFYYLLLTHVLASLLLGLRPYA